MEMSRHWCSAIPGGVRLAVQIAPNAKKTEIVGAVEGVLKIKLHAQPIEGKANEALIRYIADMLHIPKSAVNITHGTSGRKKLIEIQSSRLTVESVTKELLL
jgi:uncharacterized protein (TIGR00251 family)